MGKQLGNTRVSRETACREGQGEAHRICPANQADETKTVRNLAAVGVGGNIVLVAFKLAMGILGNSMAMVTDAIHSLSDVLATAIAFLGSRMASRKPDKTHPYGHERFECLAALILAAILFATGAGIGYAGISSLASGAWEQTSPGILALVGAIASIAVKEAMFRYTLHHATRIDSAAFKADAWHHRSDALSSIGALIGITAAKLGLGWADATASAIICLFVFKVAFEVAKDAVENMLDSPIDPKVEKQIADFIESSPGVGRLDMIMTRQFGNRAYIDVEIAVDGRMPLQSAHDIAEGVHDRVESEFPSVKHIMVHVNPL